ncbi:MAG: hypothetical protein SFZ23_06875 [Planctomycetota bacterium]|nr:hypothetical protein [Planctomycetota bacterium]
MKKVLVLAAGAALAATAMADVRETTTFTGVISDGLLGTAENTVTNFNATGGYQLRKLTVSGTLTGINPETFALESRIQVTPPGGRAPFIIQPFTTADFPSGFTFNVDVPFITAFDPAGQWTFRYYESFNDAGQDAQWDTITFAYDDTAPPPPPPPESTDLGTITSEESPRTVQANVISGAATWYRFTLAGDISVQSARFFDVYTTTNGTLADPEIGIYNVAGLLEDTDDDDGPGLQSQLTYGAGERPADGTGLAYNGRDGSLAAGTYYLAVAAFPTDFGAANFSVTSTGTGSGGVELVLRTGRGACRADFNSDGSIDLFDYLDFVAEFAAGCDD